MGLMRELIYPLVLIGFVCGFGGFTIGLITAAPDAEDLKNISKLAGCDKIEPNFNFYSLRTKNIISEMCLHV